MADSDAWAALRAYASAPTVTLDLPGATAPQPVPDPPAPDPDGGAGDGDAQPQPDATPRRRFNPTALGNALDRALPVGMVDRAARIPTPGGLFPILAALLFFLLAIVPVWSDGTTRLSLIWRVLTGGAALPATPRQTTLESLGAAVQGDFSQAGAVAGQAINTAKADANVLFRSWWAVNQAALSAAEGGLSHVLP